MTPKIVKVERTQYFDYRPFTPSFMLVNQLEEEARRQERIQEENKEDMEEKELNLKPFDIKKAKEGYPVCTRDGRKARIICFNRESIGFPIIALVKNGDTEGVYQFDDKGRSNIDDEERGYDLMMYPKRKRDG